MKSFEKNKNDKKLVCLTVILISSCATDDPDRRTKTGAVVGALAGAVLGHLTGSKQGRFVGAAVGRLLRGGWR